MYQSRAQRIDVTEPKLIYPNTKNALFRKREGAFVCFDETISVPRGG
jgi:hypothetical protein